MKSPFVICSALLLIAPNAWAADPDGSLHAGKPAGLHQAQLENGRGMFVVAGAALIGITVGLATASNDVSQPTPVTTPTTTGTNP